MSPEDGGRTNTRSPDSIEITLAPLSDSTWLSPSSSTGASFVQHDFLPGYEIIRELHRGGQGIVFLANQKSMQRNVAIKVMKEGPFADPTDRARFDREVHILAQLKHPNIVTIHDSGRIAGCDYFVMDYVEGLSLDEYVAQKKPSLGELLKLFISICETVEIAHARNIIHRDLKPGNIRVDTEGRPRVLDFGLAKVVGAPRSTNATEQGMFVGSIPWASPEQARGQMESLDPRTDVYSLGVILYQLLTNHFPYDITGQPHQVLVRIRNDLPMDPHAMRRDIDRDLSTIVLKCLAKERNRRYVSAGIVANDLKRFVHGDPIDARRDSVSYTLVARGRVFGRRHPTIRRLAVFILAVLITVRLPVSLFIFRKTPLPTAYRNFAIRLASTINPPPKLDCLRVIAIDEKTNLAELARSEQLVGVSTDPKKRASLRRLHGRFMERLAAAHPRAVVWDFYFASSSPFDADFVRGVRALKRIGAEVIVGTKTWTLLPSGLPEVAPEILAETRWGTLRANFDDQNPWTIELFMKRPESDPYPSLALSTLAASRDSRAEYTIDIDADSGVINLTYAVPVPRARLKLPLPVVDRVALASIKEFEQDSKDGDIRIEDIVGYYPVLLPDDATLRAATMNYADFFALTPDALRAQIGGRIVLIADANNLKDTCKYPGGRVVKAYYGHALALEQLVQGRGISAATPHLATLQNAISAALGSIAGLIFARRFVARAIAMLVLAVAIVVACLTALLLARYLAVPYMPIISAIIGCELTALIERLTSAQLNSDTSTGELMCSNT